MDPQGQARGSLGRIYLDHAWASLLVVVLLKLVQFGLMAAAVANVINTIRSLCLAANMQLS